MASNAHGHRRLTIHVDLLVTRDGLDRIHRELEALDYLPPFPGSKNLRDTEHGVRIDFLIAGDFPGDRKPKPVAFPDPAEASVTLDGVRYLDLPTLVQLKLASGMTSPGRLKDLADVQELIKVLRLDHDFSHQLHPYVRDKFLELWDGLFLELWDGLQNAPPGPDSD